METMGDLLQRLREFARRDCTREAARDLLGGQVEEVKVLAPSDYESVVIIALEKGLQIEVRYFLSPGLMETKDDCEFRLKLRIDLTSRVKYNVFYAPYIHGQGYIRVDLGDIENKMVRKVLDDFYLPRLRDIYKPIILEFKGFFSRDFFGIEASQERAHLYYSPVRGWHEEIGAEVLEVISRLYHLDGVLAAPEVRHRLAELDVQMSFLPSIMWM